MSEAATEEGKCEYINKCRFLQSYREHPTTIKNEYINNFCSNWYNSEDCERKQQILTSECGCQPVANLAPDGNYL